MTIRQLDVPQFSLGESLTREQEDFFHIHGVIIFRNFISKEKVQHYLSELAALEQQWISEKREKVNGVPLKYGKDENGRPTIQRLCFTSQFSPPLHELLQDNRLQALLGLLYPYEGRIGENEKDGLVLNNYVRTEHSSFSQMGWHTDSPRDLFLGQRIMPMLNVGIHLDDCPRSNGGLRVLPGTHKQNMFKMLFAKKYFVDNNPDRREVGFDMYAGDLSVHDGRLWHRVQQSPHIGEKSRRRVMYVPMITGKYIPKDANSRTPFYHRFTKTAHH